jgi:hypothetical protein
VAPDDPSGARPAPVVLRIKLRYDDVEAMIQRFAPNVGKTGLFLPTKSIQPVGAEIKFELRLQTDQVVLVGLGRVKASREPDAENPKATFGMAVELMRVTRESRDLILKMLERRKALGLGDVGIPLPADIDAARRADFIDTNVSRDSGAVPAVIPSFSPSIESGPSASTPFTAPRRQSGPVAIQKIVSVEPLAPEAPRKRRVPVAELIASASGPIASNFVDDLDAEVDVAAVLARARALAGSDLDVELEALRDSAAAPLPIDIEAASAELARQLGGAAVRKSARWAPPPPTESAPVAAPVEIAAPEPAPTEIEAKPEVVAPEPAATEVEAKVEPVVVEKPEETPVDDKPKYTPMPSRRPQRISARQRLKKAEDLEEAAREYERGREREVERERELEREERERAEKDRAERERLEKERVVFERPRSVFPEDEPAHIGEPAALIHDGADPAAFEEAHEVDPEQIYEEVENTQIGQELPAVDPDAYASAARLDAELAAAEQEAASESFGFGLEDHAPEAPTHFRQDSLADALAAAADEDEIEEIDDFEILAEADAEDADLLTAAAEQEVARPSSDFGDIGQPGGSGVNDFSDLSMSSRDTPPPRPSFLNRLDLDDDSGYHVPAASSHFDEFSPEPGELDPRALSAGHALRAFEEPSGEYHGDFNAPGSFTPLPTPVDSYTRPRPPSYTDAEDFDAPHGDYGSPSGFIPPDAFDQSDVISIRPEMQRRAPDDDLENALEALDVDLDDLGAKPGSGRPVVRAGNNRNSGGMPVLNAPDDEPMASLPTEEASVVAARSGNSARPIGGVRPQKRPPTDDGIEIDFDDE